MNEDVTSAPAPAAHPVPRRRSRRSAPPAKRERWVGRAGRAAPYAVAAAFTSAVALWMYRPWKLGGAIAFPAGDSLSFHAWVQATIETGWYESADRLAWPFQQNGHTYAVTDELLFTLIGKVLAPLTGSAGTAVMWWVVLTFPAAAVLAVGLARNIGIGRMASLVPGIVFPLIPDHFYRATAHYSLSSSWAVPLGLWMAVSLLLPGRTSGRRRAGFEVAMLLGGIAISLTNAYFATFAAILIAVAGLGASIVRRSVRVLLVGIGRGLSLLVPIVVAIWLDSRYAPTQLGYTSLDITRSPADAETYGGRIIAMLLPDTDHRLAFFRDVRNSYETIFHGGAEYPALGLVSAIGFVGLVVWSVLAYWRRPDSTRDPRLSALAGLNWVAVLAYTVGGLGSIWAFVLNGGGIRVWSRMHTFIALIALLAVAIAVDRLTRALLRRIAVVLIVLLAAFDQTSPAREPDIDAARQLQNEIRGFTGSVAAREGQGASLFQLPQVSFPLTNRAVSPASGYDGFLPFLYSTGLHWSFGGYQGDPTADWQELLVRRPVGEQAALVAASGYSGIVVDTLALTPDPDLRAQIAASLGAPDITSASGRWQYYDLDSDAPVCTPRLTAAVGATALRTPILYPGADMELQANWAWASESGTTSLHILTTQEGGWPSATISFVVYAPEAELRLVMPDGSDQRVPAGTTTDITWTGAVPADGATITIERADGGGGPVQVAQLDAQASGLAPDVRACLASWEQHTGG